MARLRSQVRIPARDYKIVTLCFDSSAIRLRSKELKHLILTTGSPGFKGQHAFKVKYFQKKIIINKTVQFTSSLSSFSSFRLERDFFLGVCKNVIKQVLTTVAVRLEYQTLEFRTYYYYFLLNEVIVYPMSTLTLLRADFLTPIQLSVRSECYLCYQFSLVLCTT